MITGLEANRIYGRLRVNAWSSGQSAEKDMIRYQNKAGNNSWQALPLNDLCNLFFEMIAPANLDEAEVWDAVRGCMGR